MVWHFFKKDVLLLWPMALAVVALQVVCAMRTTVTGIFNEPVALERLTFFLPYLVLLGIAIVAVTAVHQDSLTGPHGDWLIRPVRRRDLILSKVLFVFLMVNVPLMLVDVAQQLTLHFTVSTSFGVAFSRFLILLMVVSLPALLLGAVTRSLVDSFVFGIVSAVGFVFLTMFVTTAVNPALFEIGRQTGMTWISVVASGTVIVVGGAAALAYQYTTRRTFVGRAMGLTAVLAAFCTALLLPKTAVIATQEAIWGHSIGSEIKLTFDGAGHISQVEPQPSPNVGAPISQATIAFLTAEKLAADRQMQQIRLPLNVSGLLSGHVLYADRAAVRITDLSGKILYQGAGVCMRGNQGQGVDCRDNYLGVTSNTVDGAQVRGDQRLNVPIGVYNRIKDLPVQLQISYVITEFAPQPSQSMRAAGDQRFLSELGSCATRIDRDGDEIELGCLNNVAVPSCTAAVLEDPQTKQRNPGLHVCNLSYGPWHRVAFEDAVGRSKLSIPFRDLSGLAQYPVNSAAIARARLVLTNFDPVAHFRSTVAIRSIRLVDWRVSNASNPNSSASDALDAPRRPPNFPHPWGGQTPPPDQ
jgi:hypothetical protein